VLEALEDDAALRGEPLQFMSLTEENRTALKGYTPDRFSFFRDRAGYDYIYLTSKLADLPGKHLHAKRNHINRFLEENDNWQFELLTRENLGDCLKLDEAWSLESGEQRKTAAKMEVSALMRALEQFQTLKLEGGILRSGGRPVAFTIGEKLNSDTYDVHFEKALKSVTGAYAMINREFARFVREHHSQLQYMNREDDLGLPGLRQAKLSYAPDLMLAKYSAVLQPARVCRHD
ncbi:MAG: phosphatidylglycerol lysyltransferase domain-containing protein, partial [Oscillospiraceae bacterium]|nr:phosphatidylglycerol lysyltransferase domain-containing protein [Oscillospiraceae bacterium]